MLKNELFSTRWTRCVWRMMAIVAFLGLVPVAELVAGILVAPTVVFLSEKNPTGRITLMNRSDKSQEVGIHLSFGLPKSDSLGNISVQFQDSAVTDPRSALDWVKAFPRTVVIAPGESQVVRLMARPPKGLEDGEYWARVMVRSMIASSTLPIAGEEGAISAKVNMVTQTAIMLKYRTGKLVSNLELRNATAQLHESKVDVILDMVNRGNVSYMGVVTCRLLDRDGREVGKDRINLAVYRELKRRLSMAIVKEDARPPYQVELKITSEGRTDLAPPNIIPGNKITYSVAVD